MDQDLTGLLVDEDTTGVLVEEDTEEEVPIMIGGGVEKV